MTDPLFAVLPGPAGQLRTLLDAECTAAAAAGAVLPADLVLVVAHLADRIDWAVGGRQYRGFVMITAVFRAAYRELVPTVAADDTFAPLEDMPVSTNVYAFEAIDGGTRATFTSTYDSAEALHKVLEMGVVEGASSAIDQIDGLVAV